MPKYLVHITGPTAVGKTKTAIEVAEHFNTEILSCDSRQFYREMKIGTARPSQGELESVRHHFIANKSVEEEYNAGAFEQDALSKLEELFATTDVLVMTGGSGLYLHAIWHGFDADLPPSDPKLRAELQQLFKERGVDGLHQKLNELDDAALNQIDKKNPVRIMRAIEILSASKKPLNNLKNKRKERPFEQVKIVLNREREQLYERINARVDQMIEEGLIQEARSLESFRDKNALRTVGYQELFRYFDGEIDRNQAIAEIKKNTRRYAKRQLTWFRRYEDLIWCEAGNASVVIKTIEKKIRSHETVD